MYKLLSLIFPCLNRLRQATTLCHPVDFNEKYNNI